MINYNEMQQFFNSDERIDFYFNKRQTGVTSAIINRMTDMAIHNRVKLLYVSVNYICVNDVIRKHFPHKSYDRFRKAVDYSDSSIHFEAIESFHWDNYIGMLPFDMIVLDNYIHYANRISFNTLLLMANKIRCFSTYE